MQIAYLEKDKNAIIGNEARARDAGISLKNSLPGNAKSILDIDRYQFKKGGHSKKFLFHEHKKIDKQNNKILAALQAKKPTYDFQSSNHESEVRENERIRNSL